MANDEFDARFIPAKRPKLSEGRRQGILWLLIAVGLPLIVSLFQDQGALRFARSEKIFERNITPREKDELRQAVENYRARLDAIQRVIEDVKAKYRGEIGEGYYSERWVVHDVAGLSIPFKYVLALGALIGLAGLAKLIL